MENKEQKNKQLVQTAIEEIWNGGNVKVAERLTHPDYIAHMPGGQEIHGIEGVKEAIKNFRTAFPDVRLKIVSQVADGDEVVTVTTFEGTHSGALETIEGQPDLAASGQHVSGVMGVSRMRIIDGKVVEEWVTYDEATAMQQIGAAGLRPSY